MAESPLKLSLAFGTPPPARRVWKWAAVSLLVTFVLCIVGRFSLSGTTSKSIHHIRKYTPELMRWSIGSKRPVHIPSCVASFDERTSVGYSSVIIELRDKLGKPISGTPPDDLEFKLTLSPQTIPQFHEPIQEPIPGGFKISYYATVASYRVGAGIPPQYDREKSDVKYTLTITENNSGRHIHGSPFTDQIYISPAKPPAMAQKTNTDLPLILNPKNPIYAGNTVNFHIFARDSFSESSLWSNLVDTSNDEFQVLIIHLESRSKVEPKFLTPDGGIHSVEFTPKLSGKYNISVSIKSANEWLPIGGNVNEQNPFTLDILHGPSIVSKTSVYLDKDFVAVAGQPVNFEIIGKDAHDNLITLTDSYKVFMEDETMKSSFPCSPLSFDGSHLTASCIFTKVIPNSSPKIKVYTSAGELVFSTSVDVHHGKANLTTSQIEGVELVRSFNLSENSQWKLLTKTGVKSSLFLNLYDSFSNKVTHGEHKIQYSILEGSAPAEHASFDVNDFKNGTYELIFLSKFPNDINVSIKLDNESISFGNVPFLHWIIHPSSEAYIKNIFPGAGHIGGGTNVTIFTSPLYLYSKARCWFFGDIPRYTVPGIISDGLDSILCISPQYPVVGLVTIGITVETSPRTLSANWSSFYYYDKHAIPNKLIPNWVDIKGEELKVVGENIVETGVIACKFTSTECPSLPQPKTTPAKVLQSEMAVTCQTPALSSQCTLMVEISLNSQQFHGSPLSLESIDDFLPVAPSISVSTQEDKSIEIDVSKDVKVALGSASLLIPQKPHNGRLELESKVLVYTPKKRFFGSDKFSYAVKDERGRVVTGKIDIFVQRVMAGPSVVFPSTVLLNFSTFNSLNLGKRFEGIRIADPALYFPLGDGTKLKLAVLLEITNGTFEIPRSLKNTISIRGQKKDEVHSVSFEADLQMANLVMSHLYYRPKLLNGIPIASGDEMFIQIHEVGSGENLLHLLSSQYTIPIKFILPLKLKVGSWVYNYSLDIFAIFFFIFAISFTLRQSTKRKEKESADDQLQSDWSQMHTSSKQRKQVRSFA